MLIDHGGMPGLLRQLQSTSIQWLSLFAGSREEGALSVAPLLILLDTDPTQSTRRGLLKWICTKGAYSSSILMLFSTLPLDELARRLALRLDARLPDDVDVLLRYFDGRIFEQLLTILSAEQKQAFLSVACRWWYVDRRGMIKTIDAVFREADSQALPLQLTAQQEGQLIAASEPDQIAEMLSTNVPEQYRGLHPSDNHDFILRHAEQAGQIGIVATHELALYCGLALLYGDNFAVQENWIGAMEEIRLGKTTLSEAVDHVTLDD